MPCSHLPPPDLPDPLRVDDAHLTENVLLLARGIAADLGFDRLPILADALEDAGCDNFTLLNHLRSVEPHRVECWALRRLLRTTLMLPGGVPITFAYCPPGTFLMGSDHREADEGEQPMRQVTLTKGFYAGIYPVTQRQWHVVMNSDRSEFKGDERPVERVSWEDAQSFCTNSSATVGQLLRLPTEAEWEYACRAGTTTEFYFGEVPAPELMCFDSSKSLGGSVTAHPPEGTAVVGSYPPNPWGLFDMHGNVEEWCQDLSNDINQYYAGLSGVARRYVGLPSIDPVCNQGDETHRTLRGGSWRDHPVCCRSANRSHGRVGDRHNDTGCRVVFTA